MLNFFANIPTEYLIYFLYGSSFLFLSVGILIKDMKGSNLKLADSLWLLALFGLTHGLHELVELYPLIEGDHLTLLQIFHARLLSLVLLVVSFFFLLQFGLSFAQHPGSRRWLRPAVSAALPAAWILLLLQYGPEKSFRFLGYAQSAARHTIGLAGAFLTSYGLVR
jgi:hypothetical protein